MESTVKYLAFILLGMFVSVQPMLANHCASHGKTAEKWPDISHDKLAALVAQKKVVLLDANGTRSYKKLHIPGALDVSAMDNKALASALPADKQALIVAYCGGPRCGAWKRVAKKAADLGYTNVAHYSAGIKGWQKASL
jgi:rhodanese-related sulfurtransferase